MIPLSAARTIHADSTGASGYSAAAIASRPLSADPRHRRPMTSSASEPLRRTVGITERPLTGYYRPKDLIGRNVHAIVLAIFVRARTRTQHRGTRTRQQNCTLRSSRIRRQRGRSIASTSIRCTAASALIRRVIRRRSRRLRQVRPGSKHIPGPTHERCRGIDCDP